MKKSKLTLVKERAKRSKDRRWLNEYKCECGNTTFQYTHNVRSKIVIGCGCGNIKNIPPPDSLLTLIEKNVKSIRGRVYNKYLCKCGKTVVKQGTLVRNGGIKSCGCLKENFIPPNKKYYIQPKDSKLTLIEERVKKINGGVVIEI